MSLEPIKGNVISLAIDPGRRDGLVSLKVNGGDNPRGWQMLYTRDPGTRLTLNGAEVGIEKLLAFLVSNRASVTLYPGADRYGASLKADFVAEE